MKVAPCCVDRVSVCFLLCFFWLSKTIKQQRHVVWVVRTRSHAHRCTSRFVSFGNAERRCDRRTISCRSDSVFFLARTRICISITTLRLTQGPWRVLHDIPIFVYYFSCRKPSIGFVIASSLTHAHRCTLCLLHYLKRTRMTSRTLSTVASSGRSADA